MSQFEDLPKDVYFEKQPSNWYKLFIDGKEVNMTGWAHWKIAFRRYFKRKYNVDLRTDKRIRKNYQEFSIKKVSKNTYIKKTL